MNNLIDIRSKKDYNEFHIENSINIPRIVLLSDPDKYLNKKIQYNLICEKGQVSVSCAKILNALGYNCKSIPNGVNYYKEKNNKM